MQRRWVINVLFLTIFLITTVLSFTGCGKTKSLAPPPITTDIVYIYKDKLPLAQYYQEVLTTSGYSVTLVNTSALTDTTFTGCRLIIAGDDAYCTQAQADLLDNTRKPIIAMCCGMGFPWRATFRPYFGNTCGVYSVDPTTVKVINPSDPIWSTPNLIDTSTGEITVYQGNTAAYTVHIPDGKTPDVLNLVGYLKWTETGNKMYPLAQENKYFLWGFDGQTTDVSATTVQLTGKGEKLFLNVVAHMIDQPRTLFYENFQQFFTGSWSPTNNGWTNYMPGTGNWTIETADSFNRSVKFVTTGTDDLAHAGFRLGKGNSQWGNIRITAKLTPHTVDQCIGLVREGHAGQLGWVGEQAVYLMDGNKIRVYRDANQLGSASFTYTANTSHIMTVEFEGTNIRVYMDGSSTPILNVIDSITPVITTGFIGFMSCSYLTVPAGANFDDILVTTL